MKLTKKRVMLVRLLLAAALAGAVSSCSPATVEEAATTFFIDCMANQGVPAQDVDIEVDASRHIARFEWETTAQGDVSSIGDDCEAQTLQRFEISRT